MFLSIVTIPRKYIVSELEYLTGVASKSTALFPKGGVGPVSYTHLDVYKRQLQLCITYVYIYI